MELRILKYGNLMGSPDMKSLMHDAGRNTREADVLWDDLAAVKLKFGQDGSSTSALLIEPDCPDLFPAIVDASCLCASPASHGEEALMELVAAVRASGAQPSDVKSLMITHPHPDHFDRRMLKHFPNAKFRAHDSMGLPDVVPLGKQALAPGFVSLDTPGHGTPHCSFVADLDGLDCSVCIAGDLIMSHAHFLAREHPLSFADHKAARGSIDAVMRTLASRPTRYSMVLPGHDMPFFVDPEKDLWNA
jgi:glyoxylase-like metal-dependent hydrolase (beta-lactamase superfamily II)